MHAAGLGDGSRVALDDALIERTNRFLDGKTIHEELLLAYIASEARKGPVSADGLLRRVLDLAERAA